MPDPEFRSLTFLRDAPITSFILHPEFEAAFAKSPIGDDFKPSGLYDVALLFITGSDLDELNSYWPNLQAAHLPEKNLLKANGGTLMKTLGLTVVGYGRNEIYLNGASPADGSGASSASDHVQAITTAGERRVGRLQPRSTGSNGLITYSISTNLDDFDGAAVRDSGAPIFLGNEGSNLQIAVHVDSPKAAGHGPRLDHPNIHDFICEHLPAGYSPCEEE